LRALLDEKPDHIGACDRLAELAIQEGRPHEAASLRRKKAELKGLRERYESLISRDDRAPNAAELERLARRLVRNPEARGWSSIRQGRAARTPLVLV
jgi:hypothetical protein